MSGKDEQSIKKIPKSEDEMKKLAGILEVASNINVSLPSPPLPPTPKSIITSKPVVSSSTTHTLHHLHTYSESETQPVPTAVTLSSPPSLLLSPPDKFGDIYDKKSIQALEELGNEEGIAHRRAQLKDLKKKKKMMEMAGTHILSDRQPYLPPSLLHPSPITSSSTALKADSEDGLILLSNPLAARSRRYQKGVSKSKSSGVILHSSSKYNAGSGGSNAKSATLSGYHQSKTSEDVDHESWGRLGQRVGIKEHSSSGVNNPSSGMTKSRSALEQGDWRSFSAITAGDMLPKMISPPIPTSSFRTQGPPPSDPSKAHSESVHSVSVDHHHASSHQHQQHLAQDLSLSHGDIMKERKWKRDIQDVKKFLEGVKKYGGNEKDGNEKEEGDGEKVGGDEKDERKSKTGTNKDAPRVQSGRVVDSTKQLRHSSSSHGKISHTKGKRTTDTSSKKGLPSKGENPESSSSLRRKKRVSRHQLTTQDHQLTTQDHQEEARDIDTSGTAGTPTPNDLAITPVPSFNGDDIHAPLMGVIDTPTPGTPTTQRGGIPDTPSPHSLNIAVGALNGQVESGHHVVLTGLSGMAEDDHGKDNEYEYYDYEDEGEGEVEGGGKEHKVEGGEEGGEEGEKEEAIENKRQATHNQRSSLV
ncbi:hypothetical protein ADUPG1_012328, partial [Aduncisulcus paluster]